MRRQIASRRVLLPASERGARVPRRPPIPREEREQVLLFGWARHVQLMGPDVEPGAHLTDYLHAIPNGGARDAVTGARLKRQGVLPGVSDVFLPLARRGYHGLYLELKAPKGGVISEAQGAWLARMERAGYLALCCAGGDAARQAIAAYLDASALPIVA